MKRILKNSTIAITLACIPAIVSASGKDRIGLVERPVPVASVRLSIASTWFGTSTFQTMTPTWLAM